jgi:hypothetical protein
MTSDIFVDWLKKVDAKMQREKKHIALVIDNCPAHPPILASPT